MKTKKIKIFRHWYAGPKNGKTEEWGEKDEYESREDAIFEIQCFARDRTWDWTEWNIKARAELEKEGVTYAGTWEELWADESPEGVAFAEKIEARTDKIFDAEIAEFGSWDDGDFDVYVDEVQLGTVYRIEPNGETVALYDEAEEKDVWEIVLDDSRFPVAVRSYIGEDGPTDGLKKYYVEVDNFDDEDKEKVERLEALEWVWVENKEQEGGAQ